ncbi:MFS transporter [Yonghaparkia sp. Soil809]|uniref:MFS transporter n=1 Tax=Yonghaparkia sp. Soil809 TaxID=1736417 RepID=UPI0009EA4A9D|nr:MFS transporter [Yonghaparkia sp. Soil809]
MLTVLRHRRFAALFASQVASLVGTGVLTVALALVAVRIAGEGAAQIIGIALTIRIAAYVVVSPIASALVAGRSSRAVLISADAARVVIAAGLVLATEAWHLYVAILLLQSASAVFTPTYQAVIPEVLPDERDYTSAQSLSRLAYDLESLLSPVLAALLVLVLPPSALFAVTAAGFALSALAVGLSRISERAGAAGEPFASRLTRGLRLMTRIPALRFLAVLDAVTATVYATVLVTTVVLLVVIGAADVGDPSGPLAVALVAFGAGSIAVALLLPRILDRGSDGAVMATGAAIVPVALAATAALALTGALTLPLVIVLWFVLGAASSAISTPSARIIRREVEPDDRPAVFAARFSSSHAWYAVTYPIAGLVGSAAGPAAATAVLAVVALLALGAALALSRGARPSADAQARPPAASLGSVG